MVFCYIYYKGEAFHGLCCPDIYILKGLYNLTGDYDPQQ